MALPWHFTVVSVHTHRNRTQLIVIMCILSPCTWAAKENKKLEAETLLYTERAVDFRWQKRDCSMIYAILCRPPAKSWQGTEKREGEHTHADSHAAHCVTHWSLKKYLEKTVVISFCEKQTKMLTLMTVVVFYRVFFSVPVLAGFALFIIQWWKNAIPVRVYLFLSSR